nr:PREDICTED: interleukin-12 receptor subunit beta-2-like [Latimeria chalumnae]|eukprot:XP_014345496.1 PREDICTED: interleukin-12 receptor subunit beta-2-like [Latimeria chalumnae]
MDEVYTNGSKLMIVLIKSPRHDTRGRISGYKVFHKDQENETLVKVCPSIQQENCCAVQVPSSVQTAYVTAFNSKGDSAPAFIPFEQESLASPKNVQLEPANVSGILVKWNPPESPNKPVLHYVVEWRATDEPASQQLLWKKVPHQNTFTFIKELEVDSDSEHREVPLAVDDELEVICMGECKMSCPGKCNT